MDSDGDGKTNGLELGDPTCSWTSASLRQVIPIGHPGICEPVNSIYCILANSVYDKSDLPCHINYLDNSTTAVTSTINMVTPDSALKVSCPIMWLP
ncbi:unnamed protein product [Protopolystoma xenopodis]|uniref:Temptin Cys/Cys disulfide domain-containing protein n=1 Tax=Protopolystoma xenopodis TaxID=117903 RepID=A0A3S5BHU7_9PLAT|nr:unnamed protein product [Protopolystoma xenopodis]